MYWICKIQRWIADQDYRYGVVMLRVNIVIKDRCGWFGRGNSDVRAYNHL